MICNIYNIFFYFIIISKLFKTFVYFFKFVFDFINFKASKGSTFERILIIPTSGIEAFIQKNEYLESTAAATFYVAVTRAQQSVAIVIGKPGQSNLPIWKP